METKKYDIVIIGAGAAGLMTAVECAKRGRTVCILEHNDKVGKKIRISGGGRCNFTNTGTTFKNFISENYHFSKSALAQFGPWEIMSRLAEAGIPYHEKKDGQQFCDHSAQDLINYFLEECKKHRVEIHLGVKIIRYGKDDHFYINTSETNYESESLIIASGALSIPKIGASGLGYSIAKKFGHKLIEQRPGLVPFLLSYKDMSDLLKLRGVSIDTVVSLNGVEFRENILFTHKGLSGPAILQISSYWSKGDQIEIDLLPGIDVLELITLEKRSNSKRSFRTLLSQYLPNRFVDYWVDSYLKKDRLADLSNKDISVIVENLKNWKITPTGTEGYKKAEVTVGGVSTENISSKTMESKLTNGLYFIGEVLDVTGHLGGHNFQWAWSSGYVAGQYA